MRQKIYFNLGVNQHVLIWIFAEELWFIIKYPLLYLWDKLVSTLHFLLIICTSVLHFFFTPSVFAKDLEDSQVNLQNYRDISKKRIQSSEAIRYSGENLSEVISNKNQTGGIENNSTLTVQVSPDTSGQQVLIYVLAGISLILALILLLIAISRGWISKDSVEWLLTIIRQLRL